MRIDIADPATEQCPFIDKKKYFGIPQRPGFAAIPARRPATARVASDCRAPIRPGCADAQAPARSRAAAPGLDCQSADDRSTPKCRQEPPGYPGPERLRGTGLRSGSLPPSRASLRALSRSINAFNASRTSADFSFTPVKASAFSSNASSRVKVVRIADLIEQWHGFAS